MKKFLCLVLAALMLPVLPMMLASCSSDAIVVHTNAYFAPFEYYDGTEIVGVDVDIMKKVGEKMGREIKFENVEFSLVIDNVSAGKVCDVGAAGITVTDERKEKVDFSIPYYTSVQYVIYEKDNADVATVDGKYIVWDALAGMKIGVQTDTTGWIYADGEINATADNDYGYDGVLYGKDCELLNYDNAQLAADAVIGNQIDVVVIDQLPAEYITDKNDKLVCLPLYYKGAEGEEDSPVEEAYAICVTKGQDELLDAINEVLTEMLKEDANGETEIDRLIMKHMGLE